MCIRDRPLTQNQFDALTSMTYNIGCGNFKSSTLAKEINAGNSGKAPSEMMRWNKVTQQQTKTVNGVPTKVPVLVVSRGLSNRREQEAKLFSGFSPSKLGTA